MTTAIFLEYGDYSFAKKIDSTFSSPPFYRGVFPWERKILGILPAASRLIPLAI